MGRFTTDPACIAQREFLGIPAWHAAGYRGQGLVIFCDDVGGSHTDNVKDIFQTILPEATIYSGTIGYTTSSGVITSCNINCRELGITLPFDQFVTQYGVDLINNSTDGGNGTQILPIAVYMRDKIVQHNLIFAGAAGNGYGAPTENKFNGACVMITSAELRNGQAQVGTDAAGPNVDFAMFHGWQPGSSFASPVWLAMAGLLRNKRASLTQAQAIEYFKPRSVDIGDPGRDDDSGWGVSLMGPAVIPPSTPKEPISAQIYDTPVQILPSGEVKMVRSIFYGNENYVRLRDNENVLGLIDVEYDPVNNIPTVED